MSFIVSICLIVLGYEIADDTFWRPRYDEHDSQIVACSQTIADGGECYAELTDLTVANIKKTHMILDTFSEHASDKFRKYQKECYSGYREIGCRIDWEEQLHHKSALSKVGTQGTYIQRCQM